MLLRGIALMLLVMLTVGFRSFYPRHYWSISKQDPTLWVQFCDGFPTTFARNVYPSGDRLSGTTPSRDTILQTVIDDYNQVSGSYLRLAPYPADPSSAPVANRTIAVCQGNPSGVSGGQAGLKGSGEAWTGCEITFSAQSLRDGAGFAGTLTHEIGHCLGLTHPQETVNAVMSYFSKSDAIRLMLDDKMGIEFLYPVEEGDGKEQATFGVLGCSPK